jgi:hypothetical protein
MFKIFTWLFIMAVSGCAGEHGLGLDAAHAQGSTPPDTQGRVTTSDSGTSFTLVIAPGQTQLISSEALSIKLLELTDSRCPVGAHCVWAGQATAKLLVSHAGAAPLALTIGTPTPPGMQLPFQAISGSYKFSLTALEPLPTTQGTTPDKRAKATILIEKIAS